MKKTLITLSIVTLLNLNAVDKLDKDLGQMFMLGFKGTKVTKEFCSDIGTYNLGGVILFGNNIKNKSQLKKLTAKLQSCSINNSLLIAVDQEGGKVMRLRKKHGFHGDFLTAKKVSLMKPEEAKLHYERMAKELQSVGINYNLAPNVDLDINKKSYIIHKLERSYSSNPKIVSYYASLFIETHNKENLLTTLKHFPGHGSASGDTHKGFVDVTKVWTREELKPYITLKNYIDSVMVAHVFNRKLDPMYPASLSKPTIDGILRGEIGYQGVVITDDLQMGAVVTRYKPHLLMELAINAGNDILLFGNQVKPKHNMRIGKLIAKLRPKFRTNDLSRERINLSLERIREMKKFIGLKNRN